MDRRAGIRLALLLLALAALGFAGCGGSGSSSEGGSTAGGSSSGAEGSTAAEAGSSKPAAGFVKKGANNSLAEFGTEAPAEEREAASTVLEENLKARASGDYATQCESLSARSLKKIEENSGPLGKQPCAQKLGAEAKKAPTGLLEDTMTEPVAALRVKGNRGWALYHGKGGKNYAMAMEKEANGEWKVASLTTQTLP